MTADQIRRDTIQKCICAIRAVRGQEVSSPFYTGWTMAMQAAYEALRDLYDDWSLAVDDGIAPVELIRRDSIKECVAVLMGQRGEPSEDLSGLELAIDALEQLLPESPAGEWGLYVKRRIPPAPPTDDAAMAIVRKLAEDSPLIAPWRLPSCFVVICRFCGGTSSSHDIECLHFRARKLVEAGKVTSEDDIRARNATKPRITVKQFAEELKERIANVEAAFAEDQEQFVAGASYINGVIDALLSDYDVREPEDFK